MEFIMLDIKLMATFIISFILFCLLFEMLSRSKFHTFTSVQRIIRKTGKRKFIRKVFSLLFMIAYIIFVGRVDINIYQMGILMGMGYSLIHIVTKPKYKAKSTRRVEQA
jgi:Na+-transporting NADH:ubiquinone oxidoreductase subunit NqrB